MKRVLHLFGRALILIGLVLATLPFIGGVASAALVANPPLPSGCGIDLGLILDRSGSIGNDDDEVAAAAQAFVDALDDTGSRVKISTFANSATGLDAAGAQTAEIADVVYRNAAAVNVPNLGSNGGTNWDDGIEVMRRSTPGDQPDLVIMITDGNPTYRNAGAVADGNTEDGHGNAQEGTGNTTSANDLGEAADEADALRALSSHVFVLGVGGVSESNIQQVAGNARLEGADGNIATTGDNTPFASADYSLVDDFDDLGARMRAIVTEQCFATITVDKNTVPAGLPQGFDFDLLDDDDVIDSIDDLTHADPAEGFEPVVPGTYTVSEAAVTGFTQTSATCDDTSTPATESESPVDLAVETGEAWLCTFTNTAANGSVTIVKNASGADGTFDFTGSLDVGGFSITTVAGTGSEVFSDLTPGTYSVAESDPAPWTLASATCDDQSNPASIQVGPGENVTCTFTNRAPAPTIVVTKTAQSGSVPEPGGPVTFDLTVTNTSVEDLTLTSLIDNVDGGPDIDVTTLPGDCSVPQALPLGGDPYSCSFTLDVTGNAGDVVNDVLTGTAVDSDQTPASDSEDASVSITDVDPEMTVTKTANPGTIAENGAQVVYTVEIDNTGVDPLTITSMTDSVEGGAPVDITTVGGDVIATTCPPAPIPAGGSASCTFTMNVDVSLADLDDGDVDDTVSVTAQPDEGEPITEIAIADVTVTDLLPAISVTKTAVTTTVSEAGGPLSFDVDVVNTSDESVTITSITDSIEGGAPIDLTAVAAPVTATTCDALVGWTIAPAGSASCSFTVTQDAVDLATLVDGDIDDTVTVSGTDDEGNPASDSGSTEVEVTDVRPSVEVDKVADPTSIPETGGTVTYSVDITNTSAETVTIVSVTDVVEVVDGDDVVVATDPSSPVGTCGALVGTTLAPDETVSCEFTLLHEDLDAGWTVGDVVTVGVVDNDSDEPVTDSDDATVDVTDVAPTVTVDKQASVDQIAAPGGDITYTVTVVNTSAESVTITSLVDDPAFPEGGCTPDLIGVVLDASDGEPGGDDTATCTFTAPTGIVAPGDVVSDTVTVVVVDNDGSDGEGSATESVDVVDEVEVIDDVVEPEPEVLPNVIQRPSPGALAFTGMDPRHVLTIALSCILLGGIVLLGCRETRPAAVSGRHER